MLGTRDVHHLVLYSKVIFANRLTSFRSICLYVSTDKPAINTTKLPKKIPVFRGYPEDLVCEADGHPRPNIQWIYSPYKVPRLSKDTLTVYEAGLYNCTATNEVDSTYYVVEVILKGNYSNSILYFLVEDMPLFPHQSSAAFRHELIPRIASWNYPEVLSVAADILQIFSSQPTCGNSR